MRRSRLSEDWCSTAGEMLAFMFLKLVESDPTKFQNTKTMNV